MSTVSNESHDIHWNRILHSICFTDNSAQSSVSEKRPSHPNLFTQTICSKSTATIGLSWERFWECRLQLKQLEPIRQKVTETERKTKQMGRKCKKEKGPQGRNESRRWGKQKDEMKECGTCPSAFISPVSLSLSPHPVFPLPLHLCLQLQGEASVWQRFSCSTDGLKERLGALPCPCVLLILKTVNSWHSCSLFSVIWRNNSF